MSQLSGKGTVDMASTALRTILITGGAGFIGSNLAERLLRQPDTHVRILDNLSRDRVSQNLSWLRTIAARERLEFFEGSVCKPADVQRAVAGRNEVYHFAAQVAVTTSLDAPAADFNVNAAGTLNLLEAVRHAGHRPFLLYTSTNKVYGSLHGVPAVVDGTRYRAVDKRFRGVAESEPLDFHSPYGCSKGCADQYVRDYARIYDLPTVVFRMSCIAGPRQFGNEDQGWVAHFLYSVLNNVPITIYGDGYQVRDVLHVHDLLDAMEAARLAAKKTSGEIYNLGGGMDRSVSVLEMLRLISREAGRQPDLRYHAVRPGDQPLYISDTSKLTEHTGWHPSRSLQQILESIHTFWRKNQAALLPQLTSAQAMLETEEVA